MTSKESIELIDWCKNCVIAAKWTDTAIQIEQIKLLSSVIPPKKRQ